MYYSTDLMIYPEGDGLDVVDVSADDERGVYGVRENHNLPKK